MATIEAQTVNGPHIGETESDKLTAVVWTAAETTGDTIIFPTGRGVVLFRNSGATPRQVTVESSHDAYGRLADISAFAIAAGAILGFEFQARGWEQTLGGRDLAVTCNNAEVLIAAISL